MLNIITLYYDPDNPPCRAVLLTGATLDINFDLKHVVKVENGIGSLVSDELREINPKHTVPTIKDGEFSLWDSRNISIYLAEKYDKRVEFNLFPKDPEIRAIIRQRLYHDVGYLSYSFTECYYPVIYENKNFDPTHCAKVVENFWKFNTILEARDKLGEENLYSAADWLTVADLNLAAIVASFVVCDFHIEKFPFVEKWYNTVKKIGNFEEANIIPLCHFKHLWSWQKSKVYKDFC